MEETAKTFNLNSFLSDYWWALAIGAAVILIIVVTLIIVSNNKKRRRYGNYMMPNPPYPQGIAYPQTPAPAPAPAYPSAPAPTSTIAYPQAPASASARTIAPEFIPAAPLSMPPSPPMTDPAPLPPPLGLGNAHHIGKRENQQDSFTISNMSNAELCARKGILCVVADGMGGMADGAEISAIVISTMQQHFNEAPPLGQPAQELLNMVVAANENVNRFVDGRSRGGSTVVATIVHEGKLYWISVGDSRIYLIRQGAIVQLNTEHVYMMDLAERVATGEISWEEAQSDPQKKALTSYLGMGQLEKIDRNLQPVDLIAGDYILLMSDGIFGTLSNDEILGAITPYPYNTAEELERRVLAKQKPNQDNLTAVVVRYL
jgi:serine/threonine protein phosphatase PrpC